MRGSEEGEQLSIREKEGKLRKGSPWTDASCSVHQWLKLFSSFSVWLMPQLTLQFNNIVAAGANACDHFALWEMPVEGSLLSLNLEVSSPNSVSVFLCTTLAQKNWWCLLLLCAFSAHLWLCSRLNVAPFRRSTASTVLVFCAAATGQAKQTGAGAKLRCQEEKACKRKMLYVCLCRKWQNKWGGHYCCRG